MYETSTLWLYGSNVKRNRCRNPMMINNVGGYVGVGKYKYKTDRDVYKTWIHMLNRVHEQKGPYKVPRFVRIGYAFKNLPNGCLKMIIQIFIEDTN